MYVAGTVDTAYTPTVPMYLHIVPHGAAVQSLVYCVQAHYRVWETEGVTSPPQFPTTCVCACMRACVCVSVCVCVCTCIYISSTIWDALCQIINDPDERDGRDRVATSSTTNTDLEEDKIPKGKGEMLLQLKIVTKPHL